MNQILSNIQKVVDDSVLLFTLKVSEKYNVDQNELYNLWKEMCGDDGNDSGNGLKKLNKRKITKKKIPKSKKEKVVKSPLEKKSIAALKKMCKERGLTKYSTLKKKQLVDLLQQHSEEDKKVPPLENVLDDVLEDMENLNIKGKVEEKTEPDFNEEDIVEEY